MAPISIAEQDIYIAGTEPNRLQSSISPTMLHESVCLYIRLHAPTCHARAGHSPQAASRSLSVTPPRAYAVRCYAPVRASPADTLRRLADFYLANQGNFFLLMSAPPPAMLSTWTLRW